MWNICLILGFLTFRWHDAGTYDAETKTGGPYVSIRNEDEFSQGGLDFCG